MVNVGKYTSPMDVMLWDDFFKKSSACSSYRSREVSVEKLESFPLIFLDDITALHHLIFQTGTKKNPEIILLLINN